MTTEVIAQTLTANQQATFGAGSMFYIKSSTAPLTIVAESQGSGASVRKFINVPTGFRFLEKDGTSWKYLRVVSAVTQAVEIVIGDDDVTLSNAVTVVGTVNTVTNLAGTISDSPPVALPNAAQTQLVPVNANRYSVTVTNPSGALGSFFIRKGGGANNLLELQPGLFAQFNTSSALDARNDSGQALTALIMEQSP